MVETIFFTVEELVEVPNRTANLAAGEFARRTA